jgi:hypothetical protein
MLSEAASLGNIVYQLKMLSIMRLLEDGEYFQLSICVVFVGSI